MENYKVDYEHNIKKAQTTVGYMTADGDFDDKTIDVMEGTISVWEQRILKRWKGMTMTCTVTDKEDLIDYNVEIREHKPMHEGMSYYADVNKKSNEGHWITLFITLGGGSKGEVFVEPYDASMDPEFDYNDIQLAIKDYAQNNLY
jgi:hypothetical protein